VIFLFTSAVIRVKATRENSRICEIRNHQKSVQISFCVQIVKTHPKSQKKTQNNLNNNEKSSTYLLVDRFQTISMQNSESPLLDPYCLNNLFVALNYLNVSRTSSYPLI